MSFNDLIKAKVEPKKEEIVLESEGKKVKFYASSLRFLEKLYLAALNQSGKEAFSYMILCSITDENGDHMTADQLDSLPEEVQIKFFEAAAKVNNEVTEKN